MSDRDRIQAVLREALPELQSPIIGCCDPDPDIVDSCRDYLAAALAERVAAMPGLTIAEAAPMTVDEINAEVGPRTPIDWDDNSPDPWATKPKE